MNEERVVITGIGAIAPESLNQEEFWNTITSGKSTASTIEKFDITDYATKFACECKKFNALDYFDKKSARKKDRYVHFGVAAAREAAKQAGITQENIDINRAGVILAAGIGGIETLEKQIQTLHSRGPSRVSPFVIPMFIINIVSGEIAIDLGFKGPNYSVVSACASGTHAIANAFDLIKLGRADIIFAGGAEAAITPVGVAGFCAMKALSTRNDAPEKASRPFDKDRDGFVMSEGSGLLVLESLTSAKKRGANILAEVGGYGATADAHHITAPAPGGEGGARAMQMALDMAGLKAEDVDYINAHGTSTPYNDKFETAAIKTVFGDHAKKLKISSIKSSIGHLLGASGGIEAVACVQAINKGIIPPTVNYETPDEECDLDYVPNTAVKADVKVTISNSLGFGGHNGSVLIKKFEE